MKLDYDKNMKYINHFYGVYDDDLSVNEVEGLNGGGEGRIFKYWLKYIKFNYCSKKYHHILYNIKR